MKILVTGGAGFIGSNLIRHMIFSGKYSVINIDKLTYAGNKSSLKEIEDHPSYKFFNEDIANLNRVHELIEDEKPDSIMNLAAESHVDRSIDDPFSFLRTNVMGTYALLESAKNYIKGLNESNRRNFCFHHISTDEVFGSLDRFNKFNETSSYSPNSPYSASKASSDHLVRAWGETFHIPYLITNCSNNYGPYQHPEKLIPTIILNALSKSPIPIYGTGQNIRDWLYVQDHVEALLEVLANARKGETYCIGGNNEMTNLEVAMTICSILDELAPSNDSKIKSYKDLITYVEDRPGHDLRYAIDSSKITEDLKWIPKEDFNSGIKKTVKWYLDNQKWCSAALDKGVLQERMGLGN